MTYISKYIHWIILILLAVITNTVLWDVADTARYVPMFQGNWSPKFLGLQLPFLSGRWAWQVPQHLTSDTVSSHRTVSFNTLALFWQTVQTLISKVGNTIQKKNMYLLAYKIHHTFIHKYSLYVALSVSLQN